MKDPYQKYRFSAINIKKDVAVRFRNFSRLVSDSHTHTLERVMNFFEWNDLSPNDDLGINNNRTNKRINAVIAILVASVVRRRNPRPAQPNPNADGNQPMQY